MKGRDLLSLSFRVIGLLFAGIAAIVAVSTGVFLGRAVRREGTVVDYRVEQNAITFLRQDGESGILYYPVVEYATADGEALTVTGRTGYTTRPYETGDRVSVLVNPREPGQARLDSTFGVWGSSIVLGGLGALFLLISVLAPFGFGGGRRSS